MAAGPPGCGGGATTPVSWSLESPTREHVVQQREACPPKSFSELKTHRNNNAVLHYCRLFFFSMWLL